RSFLAGAALLALAALSLPGNAAEPYLSPTALAATKDGQTLFIACATGKRVLRFDTASRQVTASIALPAPPSGLALSDDATRLFVTCTAPESQVCIIDIATGKIAATLPAGHTAMAPVLSPDGKTLFVCNRFNNDIGVLDLASGKLRCRIPVQREPVAAAITPDSRFLLVANHLHRDRSDAAQVSAVVSVIDTAANRVVKELTLPDGSGLLNDLRISPDGKFAAVSHILSRFRLPATQLDRGWMNSNAATFIDLAKLEVFNTVLLDNVDAGAANPWAVAWSQDSKLLLITHAGTHEISLIDFPATLARLAQLPATLAEAKAAEPIGTSRIRADVPNDLAFLLGVRQRLKLPSSDLGPRALVVVGNQAYAANYFSDSLTAVGLAAACPPAASLPLGPKTEMTQVRQGEFYFHDAGLCFQGWQSCSTCHPGQARVDGLNWDLLNAGIGNPKNVRSLLLVHKTPPAMSMGVRETAESAVRAGIRHILFTVQPESVPTAIDAYLKSLKPLPSPYLVKGRLSAAARRGEKLFKDRGVGCASCHPSGLFTDLQSYDVGTRGAFDKPTDRFDTPTLVEVWRTAPYLHDGSAATLREVLTTRNRRDEHGKTSHLTPQQIEDLAAYILSL
ncbi:MAG TPA: c-type cytochrome, partial [Bacillota bacterium]|nr:c-type cytochrome [Bacillota bacterium]